MLINNITNKPVFRIFFIGTISAIIIPLTLIVGFLFAQNHKNLADHLDNISQYEIMSTKDSIDIQFSQFSNGIGYILENPALWDLLYVEKTPAAEAFLMHDLSESLTSHVSNIPNIESIYVYIPNKEVIITNSSKYNFEDFHDKDILTADYKDDFTITGPRTVNSTKLFSFVAKINMLKSDSYIYIYLNVNYNKFYSKLNYDTSSTKSFIISDVSENILYCNNDKFLNEPSVYTDKPQKLKIGNETYRAYYANANQLPVTYILLYDYNAYMQPIHNYYKLVLFIILISVAFIIAIAYFFSSVFYKPIKKLAEYINADEIEGENEFDIIDNKFTNMLEQHTDLIKKYDTILPFFEQYSLHQLLNNPDLDIDIFNQMVETLDLQFTVKQYYLAIIDYKHAENLNDITHTLNSYKSDIHVEMKYFTINRIRMVLICASNSSVNQMFTFFDKLKEEASNNGLHITMALSEAFSDLSMISKFYQLINKKLDNLVYSEKSEVYVVESNNEQPRKTILEKELGNKLAKEVVAGMYDEAATTLNEIRLLITENFKNIEWVKYIYYEFATNILILLEEVGINIDECYNLDYKAEISGSIEASKTINETHEVLENLIEQIKPLTATFKEEQALKRVNSIIEYINNNYTKDISLDEIASVVFLTPRYVGNLFKKAMGVTIKVYITELRMNHASELLLNTNKPVSVIANKVGYNNIQSFLRVFKEYYHMTPTNYRKKHLN